MINGKNVPFALMMIFLFTTLISASDFFGVVVAIVPAIMALIMNARSYEEKSFVPKISASIICGLVASKIIHIIIVKNGGFYSREIHARFLPFDELPQRAIYTIQSVLDFFWCRFPGETGWEFLDLYASCDTLRRDGLRNFPVIEKIHHKRN